MERDLVEILVGYGGEGVTAASVSEKNQSLRRFVEYARSEPSVLSIKLHRRGSVGLNLFSRKSGRTENVQ